jgi:hypothetical protein
VIWECILAFRIFGPITISAALNMVPVRISFKAVFDSEMEPETGGDNMACLVAIVKRSRVHVLAQVHCCMSGRYRA